MNIFLSYHVKDEGFVQDLSGKLRSREIYPFIRNLKLGLGRQVLNPRSMRPVLGDCNHAILVLSKSYLRDSWFEAELLGFLFLELVDHCQLLPAVVEKCRIPVGLQDKLCVNFMERDFDQGVNELIRSITGLHQAFVVMKFGDDHLQSVYKHAIEPVLKEHGYSPLKMDDPKLQTGEEITSRVLEQIKRSDIVVADFTGERPNCFYEAGYAQALGKDLILTAQEGTKLPFDLSTYPYIKWRDTKHLAEELRVRLDVIRNKNPLKAPCLVANSPAVPSLAATPG